WLPVPLALAVSTLAVLAFNWHFVPPRSSFAVDAPQHLLLLGAMLAVSWIVAGLMALQRRRAVDAQRHQQRAEQLRRLGDALRDDDAPLAHAGTLQQALSELTGVPVTLLLLKAALPRGNDDMAVLQL